MNELALLEGMNDIDPELLVESSAARKHGKGKALRRILLPALIALLLGGLAGYAIGEIADHVSLREREGINEQGFEAKIELPLVKWSDFKGEIADVGEKIAKQYAEHQTHLASSIATPPGMYGQKFDSLMKAMAYIGLEGLKKPAFPHNTEWSVFAYGDADGKVSEVQLYGAHIVTGQITMQERVTILTENAQQSKYVTGGTWTYEFPRNVEFLHYTTPGGRECSIAVLYPQYENNYIGLTGYVAAGSAFYELNLGAVPKDAYDQALKILHDWADAYD